MARFENPPFGRGDTFSNTFAAALASTSDGQQMEGKEWWFEDVDPVAKVTRSGRYCRCRIVRNVSGGALLPKRLVNVALAPINSGYFGGQVDGYNATLAGGQCYPADEFLPAGGVQNNDLFWVVVEGPAVVLTDLAALTGAIAIGDRIVGQTAATSGATTAGRVLKQDLTGATAPLGNQVQNAIGRAMSAATTSQTNTGILCDVGAF